MVVSTGSIQRSWDVMPYGLVTTSVKNLKTGKEWVNSSTRKCDWDYYGKLASSTNSKLVGITAIESSDSGFTSPHILVEAEFEYPLLETFVKCQIRVFPNAEGIYSRIAIKGSPLKYLPDSMSITGRVDFVPVVSNALTRRYVGYYNDTQNRNTATTPLIKEQLLTAPAATTELNRWASVLMLESANEALIMVKESHKCVNQYGYDTGEFEVSAQGLANTGTSLNRYEILPDKYRFSWATWLIATNNGIDERELALKKFERIRFPVNPETDIYTIANTWGSGRGVNAANYNNVLVELQSQNELGIDVQQIDDGWQKNNSGTQTGGWYPHKDKFPNGFQPVKTNANPLNVKLGLWFSSMPVTLKEMKDNFDAGGFNYYKLDFASLNNHTNIEKLIEKTRDFELYAQHKSKVNWDVTEVTARFGYFWAKEYGCVFLENRKTSSPKTVIYTAYLVLRDLWHLSKYCNLNKFQGSVQNIDMVDKLASDAYKHNHPYSVAIPLMSTPLFFQETHFYSQEAKNQIKPVLAAYKTVRNELYECFVYPIGNEPNNASWSGFQAHHPERNIGFINIFREINNIDSTQNIQLRFLKNKKITLTNLLNNQTFQVVSDGDGFVKFSIQNSCDFRMYKYEYVDNTVGLVENKSLELYGYFNQNRLQIISAASGSFSIFAMNGQNVLNGTFKKTSVIRVNLPVGNYLLKLKSEKMSYVGKVFIQNL